MNLTEEFQGPPVTAQGRRWGPESKHIVIGYMLLNNKNSPASVVLAGLGLIYRGITPVPSAAINTILMGYK